MVNASIAISMGIACPSAHDKNIMRRETDQRGRWRRKRPQRTKWTHVEEGKAENRKGECG